MNSTAALILAFDHEVVRAGLMAMLAGEPYRVVAQTNDAASTVQSCISLRPDLLLMDVMMNGRDTLERIGEIREISATTQVIIVATSDNPTWLARSVAWGVQDYLLRNLHREELLASLQRAREGRPAPEEGRLKKMQAQMSKRRDFPKTSPPLTGREMQIARLLGLGLPNREIALTMGVRLETVKQHVQNLLRKLGAADRTQAAVLAIRNGWLSS